MSMISVNGAAIQDPSEFTWSLNDVSTSSSGRSQDAIMHKTRVAQKRKLTLAWWNPTPAQAAAILTAFNPVTFSVTYPDAMANANQTRTFYRSDPSAPVRSWTSSKKRYTSISIEIIEV